MQRLFKIVLMAGRQIALLLGWSAVSLMLMSREGDPTARSWLDWLNGFFGGELLLSLSALAAVVFGPLVGYLSRRVQQSLGDQGAQEILTLLKSGSDCPMQEFFLYLRAFSTTGQLKPPPFLFRWWIQLPQLNELETSILGQSLGKSSPLIALGRPGEHMGAGRVATDDKYWKDDITLLAKHAKGILVIPSDHEGTLWEIKFLQREGLLPKSIFIMPPSRRGITDWGESWYSASRAMMRLGIELPSYNHVGMLFTLSPNGSVRNAQPFSIYSIFPRAFRKSVFALLADAKVAADPVHAVKNAFSRSRRQWRHGSIMFSIEATAVTVVVFQIILMMLPPDLGERLRPEMVHMWILISVFYCWIKVRKSERPL